MEVGFRMDQEKKKILASRSEDRVLHVLDYVCQDLPLYIPKDETRLVLFKMELKRVCESFTGEYEELLMEAFYGRIDLEIERSFCTRIVPDCPVPEQYDHQEL